MRRACAVLVVAVGCARPVPPSPLRPADLPALTPGQAAIQGRAHHAMTGVPIAGALVILQCRCIEGARETQTDARGVYSFADLPSGKYTVQVLYGHANLNKTVELPAGRPVVIQFAVDPEQAFVVEIG